MHLIITNANWTKIRTNLWINQSNINGRLSTHLFLYFFVIGKGFANSGSLHMVTWESLKDRDLNSRGGNGGINVTMEVNDCGKSIETLTCTTVSLP